MKLRARIFASLLLAGILLRVAIFAIPKNSVMTPWSGGGDMDAYILLARNLVAGDGYSYAHVPTAFRPPGYPGMLAAMIIAFGAHFVVATRFLQILAGLGAAYFAMRTGRIWFGEQGGRAALLASLWFPTLAYFSGEILSEAFASFFVALFLWVLAEDWTRPRWATVAAMGLILGGGAYFRPNLAGLGVVALAAAWVARRRFLFGAGSRRQWAQVALVPLTAALVVAPWVVRNWLVFGRVVYSTEGGSAALFGAVNPEARDTPGSEERMRAALGYLVPNGLEVNDRSRLRLGDEVELDRRWWELARGIWRDLGWGIVPWTLTKWATFWLSLDQLLKPGHISLKNRVAHVGGVALYWAFLVMAVRGWWELKNWERGIAAILLGYAVLVTLMHTPFVMNSRIRAPVMDPLIAVLAGGGFVSIRKSYVVDSK